MKNEVNLITPNYAVKLDFRIQGIDVSLYKIYSSALMTYKMVIADFLL